MGHPAREWTMTDETLNSRKACAEDLAELLTLERRAFTELNQGRYPQELVESAAREIRMITPALIDEGHFFVLTTPDRRIAACGGWSQELPAYADDLEHPPEHIQRDTGVVRSMFVLPEMARRGLGRRMMALIEDDARAHGIRRLSLSATRMGEPLYRACGFRPGDAEVFSLSGGRKIIGLQMEKVLADETSRPDTDRVAGTAA